MQISNEQFQDIVDRILKVTKPKQIILFGSAARGDNTECSDIDVLVIVQDGTHRLDTAQDIYRNLLGVKVAVDIVVATTSDIESHHDTPGMVYREALRDGRVLYAA